MLKRYIKNPILLNLAEWAVAIGFAMILFFVARTFVFRIASVLGHSMEPSLSDGDVVILNRLSFFFSNPRVDDIVAFPSPGDTDMFYIKRIIAIPGDEIDFIDNSFYINGSRLGDPFSYYDVYRIAGSNWVDFPIIIEEGLYFVLGDNRNESRDSRFVSVGNIPHNNMVGRVWIRIWPLSSFGRVR